MSNRPLLPVFVWFLACCNQETTAEYAVDKSEYEHKMLLTGDAVVYQESWEPFRYVLKTEYGLVIPLLGVIAIDADRLELRDASVQIEMLDCDLRPYWAGRQEALDRLQQEFGVYMPISGVNGFPQKDDAMFLVVTAISSGGIDYPMTDLLSDWVSIRNKSAEKFPQK